MAGKKPSKLALLLAFESQYCDRMANEYDYPGDPWTPEREKDAAAMAARALLRASGVKV